MATVVGSLHYTLSGAPDMCLTSSGMHSVVATIALLGASVQDECWDWIPPLRPKRSDEWARLEIGDCWKRDRVLGSRTSIAPGHLGIWAPAEVALII